MTRMQQAILYAVALFPLAVAGCGGKPAAPAVALTEQTNKAANAPAAAQAAPASTKSAKTGSKKVVEPVTASPEPVAAGPKANESVAPKPVDPASAGPADGANSAPVDPEILAAIEAARGEKLGVYVRFEDRDEKQIVALINAGVTKEQRTNWTKEVKLAEGRGIPLKEVQSPLKFVTPPAERRAIAEDVQERDGWRMRKLNLRDREDKPTTAYRHLWSPDGRRLYLAAEGLGLTVIDAETWETRFEPAPAGERTGHIAWSSAGLVVLHSGPGRDASVGTPWFELEGKDPMHLSVVDPVTMEVRKCWRVGGLRVAGHPESPIIYVSQWTDQYCRLLVIDVNRGELLNVIEGSALRPKEELMTTVAPSQSRNKLPEGVVIDGPAISPDGKWLLNVPEPYVYESMARRSWLVRLEIDGPRLHCQQRLGIGPAKVRLTKISPDGRFVCICDPSGSGYGLLELTDFSQYLGAMAWEKFGGPFAVDADSKTIYIAAWSGDFGQRVLKAVRDGKPSIIPVDTKTETRMEFQFLREDSIVDLDVRPKHPGVLVLGKAGNYWIEGGKPADKWPFERNVVPESLPPNPALKAEVPTKPLLPEPKYALEDKWRVELRAHWLQWTPDGKAILAATEDGTFHRFDEATHQETHRLAFGKFTRAIPTSLGLAISDAKDSTVTLIRYDTLEPIRQFAPLVRFSGNVAHSRIVGYSSGALTMIDLATGDAIASVLQEQLNHRWPRDIERDRAICAIFADGERVLLYRDRLAILRVRGKQLVLEKIWDEPSLLWDQPWSRAATMFVLSPCGEECWLGKDRIISLNDKMSQFAKDVVNVYFGDNGITYVYGGGLRMLDKTGKTLGTARIWQGGSHAAPHPTKPRLLTNDHRYVYDERLIFRDAADKILPGYEPPPQVIIPKEILEAQRVARLTKNLQKLAASYVAFAKKNARPPLKWEDIDDADARSLELNYDVLFNMMPEEMTIGLENVILAYPRDASTKGGLVVAADGTTRTVTAAVFNKLLEKQLADLAKTPTILKTLKARTRQADKAKAQRPLREMLAAFRDAHVSFCDSKSGHGPQSWQEFEQRVAASKGLQDKFAAQGYQMVFNLGPGDLPRGGGSFKYIIAYPKNGPQQGGLVVFHDGAIKELTAAEFNETASQQAKLLKGRRQP